MTEKEFKILKLKNRIKKLSIKPLENFRLINKAKRRLRDLMENN